MTNCVRHGFVGDPDQLLLDVEAELTRLSGDVEGELGTGAGRLVSNPAQSRHEIVFEGRRSQVPDRVTRLFDVPLRLLAESHEALAHLRGRRLHVAGERVTM